MSPKYLSLVICFFLLAGCMPLQRLAFKQYHQYESEQKQLKDVRISPPKSGDFRAHPDQIIDILHMDLDVRFNWTQHECIGKCKLKLKPYFYPTDSIVLDAGNMTFNQIQITDAQGENVQYLVQYDKKQLRLNLERKFHPDEQFMLELSYAAKPDSAPKGKGRAIRDDKGLYFINTDHKEAFQPMQLWTQGETECNSNWFPTIDKPHEKFTSTLTISAPSNMTILSNGILEDERIENGQLIQKWNNRKAMPAYLIMMAIGNFQITKDQLNGMEVSYYLEPDYHPFARQIFRNTSEMIDFFSGKLGVDYPWDKYAQVVVRDYVSGAMENTSATLHGESVQKNPRELVDANNEGIIAHELFHQWFGDLVTCESWGHLFLNEGFATYGEHLWLEYKYGVNASQRKSYETIRRYINYTRNNPDGPIADFNFKTPDDVFNTLTYQKGSRVLHLLRSIVGDEAFFLGLKNYLNKYALQSAEIDDFRQEMENVCGKDLRPFFQQWIYRGGHPVIDVRYTWNDSTELMAVQVEQLQDRDLGLFHFPLKFKVRQGNQVKFYQFDITRRKEIFYIKKSSPEKGELPLVFLDPDCTFLGEIRDNKSFFSHIQTYGFASSYAEKVRSLDALSSIQNQADTIRYTLLRALNDVDEDIRLKTLNWIDWKNENSYQRAEVDLINLTQIDPSPAVRAKAVEILGSRKRPEWLNHFKQLCNDSSYQVNGEALWAIYQIAPAEAYTLAASQAPEAKGHLSRKISEIFIASGNPQYIPHFIEKSPRIFGRQRAECINDLTKLLVKINLDSNYQQSLDFYRDKANNDHYPEVRKAALKGLGTMRKQYQTAADQSKSSDIKKMLTDKANIIRDYMGFIISARPDEWTKDILESAEINYP